MTGLALAGALIAHLIAHRGTKKITVIIILIWIMNMHSFSCLTSVSGLALTRHPVVTVVFFSSSSSLLGQEN